MNIPLRPPVTDGGLLDRFEPITLERMDSIRLMNRTDTKFVTDTLTLREILEDALRHGYMAFETGGERVQAYDSIYFDTPDLRMFTDHRRGKLVRQKVRTRAYCGSGLCFLEVKKRTTIRGPARSAWNCILLISRISETIPTPVFGWPPIPISAEMTSPRPSRHHSTGSPWSTKL